MPPSITTQCLWEGREIRDSIYGETVNGRWDAYAGLAEFVEDQGGEQFVNFVASLRKHQKERRTPPTKGRTGRRFATAAL
jgi:hypothetical protein